LGTFPNRAGKGRVGRGQGEAARGFPPRGNLSPGLFAFAFEPIRQMGKLVREMACASNVTIMNLVGVNAAVVVQNFLQSFERVPAFGDLLHELA
jgi:hypothetical protein